MCTQMCRFLRLNCDRLPICYLASLRKRPFGMAVQCFLFTRSAVNRTFFQRFSRLERSNQASFQQNPLTQHPVVYIATFAAEHVFTTAAKNGKFCTSEIAEFAAIFADSAAVAASCCADCATFSTFRL